MSAFITLRSEATHVSCSDLPAIHLLITGVTYPNSGASFLCRRRPFLSGSPFRV